MKDPEAIFSILFAMLTAIGLIGIWALFFPIRKGFVNLSAQLKLQLIGISILGIITRLWLSPFGQAPVPDILASRLILTKGIQDPHPIYGAGMSVMGILAKYLNQDPTGWFQLQLILACLAPPLIWLIAFQISSKPHKGTAAWFAGLLAAIFPIHVMFSAGVLEHVSLTTLCLGAIAAGLGSQQRGFLGILAGLLAGFAAHLRPEIIPFALVLGAGLIFNLRKQFYLRWIGGLASVSLALARLMELGEKEFGTAQRVLSPKNDQISQILWDLGVYSIWQDPGSTPFFNALANLFSTPFFVWPLFLLGSISLFMKNKWLILVAWFFLYLPIAFRGYPLTDALRMQLPSLMVACAIFGVGISLLIHRIPIFPKIATPALIVFTIPLLVPVSQPWLASKYLPVLQKGTDQIPPKTTIIIPRFNSYAQKEISLAHSLIPREHRIRKRTLRETDPLPEGEVWLWWPIQCTSDVVQTWAMKPTDQEACDRFDSCDLKMVVEEHIFGRVDTGWVVPEGGVRVGWYKILSCPENQ